MEIFTFTQDQLYKLLKKTIEMQNEYQINHGYDEEDAIALACNEALQGLKEERYLVDIGEEEASLQIYLEGGSE